MIQYFKNEHGTLYQGDALDVGSRVKPESIQCCTTSPPYWGQRLYGSSCEIGLEKTPEEYVEKIVNLGREIRKVLHPSGTFWINIGDTNCVPSTVRETTLGMKPGVSVKNRIGIPWKVAFALQEDGWTLRCDIIWYKRNAPRQPVRDRPTYEHEYIFLFSKKSHYYYDKIAVEQPLKHSNHYAGDRRKIAIESGGMYKGGHNIKAELTGRNLSSVWDIPTEPRTDPFHAAFPTKLVELCVKASTSKEGCCSKCFTPIKRLIQRKTKASPWKTIGWKKQCKCENSTIIPCTVLDPFMGRGTTALTAEILNKNWVGVELYEDSCKLIKENLINRKLGLRPLKDVEDGLFQKDEMDIAIQ